MKFGNLKSFAHNLGDSLGSGICLMIGYRSVDVFAEAGNSLKGYIEIDFLTGETSGGPVSQNLQATIDAYRDSLPEHAKRAGIDFEHVREIRIHFGTRPVYGRQMGVTVKDISGRVSTDWYYGYPARRLKAAPGEHLRNTS
jgi:hypothetical protein